MISHKQLERQLIPILRPYLTLDASEENTYRLIRANQNNAIPNTGGYSTIQVISSNPEGQGETGSIVNGVGQQFRQDVNLFVSIQTFDDEAILRANKLRVELRGAPLLNALINEGFSYVDVSTVEDLTAIRDTRFEERTAIQIEFNILEGSLREETAVDPADLGKAGTPHFFDIEAIDSVNIKQYENLDDEEPIIVTPVNDPPNP